MASKLGVLAAAVAFVAATPTFEAEAGKVAWATPKDTCRELKSDVRLRMMGALSGNFRCGPEQSGKPASLKGCGTRSGLAIAAGKEARAKIEKDFPKPYAGLKEADQIIAFIKECADEAAKEMAELVMKTEVVCVGDKPARVDTDPAHRTCVDGADCAV